jgi:hypothetical protein
MLPGKGQIPMPPEMAQIGRSLQPEALANMLGLASIRQALFDILGAYPAANVLPYAYSFELSSRLGNALAANGQATATIKITADAAFIARYVNGASTGAYLIDTRIDASDRQLNNRAVHSAAFVGTAERPDILPKPLLLPANTTVSFDLTDLSGADNDVFFTLLGFKIYGYTPNV